MRREIDTSSFEFSHDRKPRGFGQWVFVAVWSDGEDQTLRSFGAMHYVSAKKLALREVRELEKYEDSEAFVTRVSVAS